MPAHKFGMAMLFEFTQPIGAERAALPVMILESARHWFVSGGRDLASMSHTRHGRWMERQCRSSGVSTTSGLLAPQADDSQPCEGYACHGDHDRAAGANTHGLRVAGRPAV
jgi:hypothetical protein